MPPDQPPPNGRRAEPHDPVCADGEPRSPMPTADEREPDWTPSADWLAGEDRADDDIRAGRVRRFASVESLLADLHAAPTESKLGVD